MLAGFYLMWIAFTAIFVTCLIIIFNCSRKKQLYTVNAFMTAVLALFSFIIIAVCSYDFYAKFAGEHFAAGQCQFTYVRGGKSIDTTEIVIDEQLYKIKSELFKKIDDGVYSCEIRYMPLTKIVYHLTIR
ncbi:MAG: cobalamin biosynthesis protein CobN [Solibacillus sp.]